VNEHRLVARGLRASVLAGGLVAFAGPASADMMRYNDYPVGGRATGLGGAFTAIANDPSGILYNPAGLVDALKTSVQVSSNLYGVEFETTNEDIFQGFSDRFGNFEDAFAQVNIIPSSAGLVSWFGDPMPDGTPKHSYALGVFVPSYRSLNVQTGGDDDTGHRVSYRRDLQDITFHAGAAYATRIDETWSFGFSTTFVYRSLRDSEEATWFEIDPAFEQATFRQTQTDIGVFVGALVMNFGMKMKISPRWSAGLSLATPSIEIFDTASLRVVRSSSDPTRDAVSFHLDNPQEVEGATSLPARLRLGLAYSRPDRLTLAVDVMVHAPTRYDLITLQRGRAGITDGLTIQTDIEHQLTINAAAGLEVRLDDTFSLASGAFTNFSSAPRLPPGDRFDRDHLPRVDMFGGSFVVRHHGDYTLTRAGVTASYGEGESVIPVQTRQERDGFGPDDFQRIDVSELLVYLFVSTTFQY